MNYLWVSAETGELNEWLRARVDILKSTWSWAKFDLIFDHRLTLRMSRNRPRKGRLESRSCRLIFFTLSDSLYWSHSINMTSIGMICLVSVVLVKCFLAAPLHVPNRPHSQYEQRQDGGFIPVSPSTSDHTSMSEGLKWTVIGLASRFPHPFRTRSSFFNFNHPGVWSHRSSAFSLSPSSVWSSLSIARKLLPIMTLPQFHFKD